MICQNITDSDQNINKEKNIQLLLAETRTHILYLKINNYILFDGEIVFIIVF